MDRGAWWATVSEIEESDRTEQLTLSLSYMCIWWSEHADYQTEALLLT